MPSADDLGQSVELRDVGLDGYEDEFVAADVLEFPNDVADCIRRHGADRAQQILDLTGKNAGVVIAKRQQSYPRRDGGGARRKKLRFRFRR